MLKEYRIKEGIGQYWNKRWEVQEKYSYYENGKRVISWHTVFTSTDKKRCENVMKRQHTELKKDYSMPFIEW